MPRPVTMTLVARGFDEAIKDRSAAAQMLGRSQRVEDITGLSGEKRGLHRNPNAPSAPVLLRVAATERMLETSAIALVGGSDEPAH